ncbi:PDR/VanB family oxidoreductase [Microbacterium sp. A196]|uniref:PDR/VanB family oxidoreductase n=1 Tax=Microbacterium sp. A196 TaxID=3457320 RepID=UPI003FD1738F
MSSITVDTISTPRNASSGCLVVAHRREISASVVEFSLRAPDGTRLPDWSPGAHIDVILDDGTTRQYSLCGDRWDAHTYRIAVQRESGGSGGSIALHDTVREGDTLRFGGPRNNFRLAPSGRYLFVAGGIGITPLLPMIHQAELLGTDWRLLYLGRSRTTLAYADELAAFTDRVTIHCADEFGRADLNSWRPIDSVERVYACGPARLLDDIEAWGAPPSGHPAKVERFTASAKSSSPATAFDVVAARSGRSTTVAVDETVVIALRRIGVDVLTSCGQGVCGTCETGVVAGRPDHRDSLLNDAERSSSECLFPCVSRSLDTQLVLDI